MQDIAARSQALDALIRALLPLTDRARLEFAAWAADNTGLAVPTSRGVPSYELTGTERAVRRAFHTFRKHGTPDSRVIGGSTRASRIPVGTNGKRGCPYCRR